MADQLRVPKRGYVKERHHDGGTIIVLQIDDQEYRRKTFTTADYGNPEEALSAGERYGKEFLFGPPDR